MLDSLMIWVRSTLDEMHGREGMVPDIPGIDGYWLLATRYWLVLGDCLTIVTVAGH